jgi:hypothetical protein
VPTASTDHNPGHLPAPPAALVALAAALDTRAWLSGAAPATPPRRDPGRTRHLPARPITGFKDLRVLALVLAGLHRLPAAPPSHQLDQPIQQGPPVTSDSNQSRAALEALAAGLDPRTFVTTLTTGRGRPPRLTVARRHTQLSQDIYADCGWYWWAWAERIAPTSDMPAATAAIARALRVLPSPSHG